MPVHAVRGPMICVSNYRRAVIQRRCAAIGQTHAPLGIQSPGMRKNANKTGFSINFSAMPVLNDPHSLPASYFIQTYLLARNAVNSKKMRGQVTRIH